jgi:dTDP-4-amino-4,6-dideoxygalactose transaminase
MFDAHRSESEWPLADDEVHAALEATYRSGEWGQYHGPALDRLAEMLCTRFGARHAMPVCSGTIAVELALRGLLVGPGDEVILAGYDFPGNFRCIEATGARPVLVDLEKNSWRIDVSQVDAAIGERTKAIVVSHLHGDLADMPALRALADRSGIGLVEDVCQTPGAVVARRPAGAWGDVSVLSFGGSKLLTAGRGGAVLTSRDEVRQRITVFCDRGNDAFPLSALQAAVLPAQLAKLDERTAMRARAVERLRCACSDLTSLAIVEAPPDGWTAAYYKVAFRYDPARARGVDRETILAALEAEGVVIGAGFNGFAKRGASRCRSVGDLRHSRRAGESTLLLHHPVLLSGDEAIDRVAAALHRVDAHFSA